MQNVMIKNNGEEQRGTPHYCVERHTKFKFPVHCHVEKAFREFSAAARGHGVFLCRGGHFASIHMARTSNLAGKQQQRTELPEVLMNNGEHSAGQAMESPGDSRVSAQNAFV